MFHKSNYGAFAPSTCDMNGYVPEPGDGPWDFAIDHGGAATHDAAGNLTPYGEWWEADGFGEWLERAVAETGAADVRLAEWQMGA